MTNALTVTTDVEIILFGYSSALFGDGIKRKFVSRVVSFKTVCSVGELEQWNYNEKTASAMSKGEFGLKL